MHIVWAACMFWKALWMLKGVYKGFRAIYSPPDDVYFREGLVYFSRTMQNHILQLLQQHGFIVEESGGWIGLPAVQIFHIQKTFGTSLYERRPQTLQQLETYIRQKCDQIPTPKLQNLDVQMSSNCFEKKRRCYTMVNMPLSQLIWDL